MAKALDRLVIKLATQAMRSGPVPSGQQEEALRLLQTPDFFGDFAGARLRIEFTSESDFQFPSRITTPWSVNNTVNGHLRRAGADWQRLPVFILLHGWNSELMYHCLFPGWAKRLNRAGINVLMLELPYHGRRRPSGPGAVTDFISGDLVRVLEATRQAVADVRALVTWALAQGCPAVGLWGVSLGGWLAGLTACADKRVSQLVLMEPAARMDRVLRKLEFTQPVRQALEQTTLELGRLNLTASQPRLSPENILIVAGRHDLFTPLETLQELRERWKQPELQVFEHGHISLLLVRPVITSIIEWIAAKTASRAAHPTGVVDGSVVGGIQ